MLLTLQRQTHFPAQDKPTLLAVRQSRSISGPLGVNVACNGGPFIYTFNHPAEHFVTTRSGELTIEGIQQKAGTNELMLLELDVSEQSKQYQNCRVSCHYNLIWLKE